MRTDVRDNGMIEMSVEQSLKWSAWPLLVVRPLPIAGMAGVVFTISAMAAIFCVVHERANARDVAASISVLWAITAITPFVAGFELGKHAARRSDRPAWLIGLASACLALATSLLFGAVVDGGTNLGRMIAQSVDRLPMLVLTAVAVTLSGSLSLFLKREEQFGSASQNQLPIPHDQIDYAISAGNYVEIHAAEKTTLVRMTISAMEDFLDETRFARIHRSTIVNLSKVIRVEVEDGSLVAIMGDGVSLRASRARARRLRDLDM